MLLFLSVKLAQKTSNMRRDEMMPLQISIMQLSIEKHQHHGGMMQLMGSIQVSRRADFKI
jgi:hypothetical protein